MVSHLTTNLWYMYSLSLICRPTLVLITSPLSIRNITWGLSLNALVLLDFHALMGHHILQSSYTFIHGYPIPKSRPNIEHAICEMIQDWFQSQLVSSKMDCQHVHLLMYIS